MFNFNFNGDCIYEILEYCDIHSFCKLLSVNKKFNEKVNLHLKSRYGEIIKIMKDRINIYFISNEDINKLLKIESSLEFKLLLILLKKFSNINNTNYSVWFNNERFDEHNHPLAINKYCDFRHRLWYNGDRINLVNKELNLTYVNLLNRYEGMGYDYSLFNIKGTNKYFFDYQGGKNGYDYDSAIEKVTNLDPKNILTMSLSEAVEKLIPK